MEGFETWGAFIKRIKREEIGTLRLKENRSWVARQFRRFTELGRERRVKKV